MSKTTFKKGQTVYVPSLKKYGTIEKLSLNGDPVQVSIDGEIINTVSLLVQAINLIERLWLSIKSLFTKSK